MGVPATAPRLISSEGDVTAGALKVNDAYDLSLYQMPNGDYELVLFMKLQFFFEDGDAAWTDADKRKYLRDWEVAIKNHWSGRRLMVTKKGKAVSLRLDFAIQEGGWMLDHWEISVTRIKAGTFRTSYVNTTWGNVVLDSEDLALTPKGHGQTQRGAVHEFGHMMGLADEYPATHAHTGDHPSVMNSGESVRARHGDDLLSWARRKLKENGVE